MDRNFIHLSGGIHFFAVVTQIRSLKRLKVLYTCFQVIRKKYLKEI